VILCGDIGGTKALLAIAELDDGKPRFLFSQRHECADYSDFDQLFERFRKDSDAFASGITGGCLAVAGPIDDDGLVAKFTNLPWQVSAVACGDAFGLSPVRLVNDFAAAAAGIAALNPDELATIQPGAPLTDGVRLVVGAGTGLGMAILVPDGSGWRVIPGEGGHAGYSPQNETQLRIHAALLADHGRVCWEQVVSGPGLAAMHRILTGRTLEPAAIAEDALNDPTSPAGDSLATFIEAYGAFAGDMALAVMARGGVFLAGGIAAKVLPLMRSGRFISAFCAKAGHAALTARMPVHVVTDPELGLKGAALLVGNSTTG
jgi:glucokinase